MKQLFLEFLTQEVQLDLDLYYTKYTEDINEDALTTAWLENQTSYIYKVGVLAAIDANKCDFVHVIIGSQRGKDSQPEIKGHLCFKKGENDDMGRTLARAFKRIQELHPAFDL